MVKRISNAAAEIAAKPILGLIIANEEGLSTQQRAGAYQASQSCMLPTKGLEAYGPGGKWESLGFKIGKVDADDPMLTECELPPGWTKRSTGSYHIDILDEKGRKRSSFFYKALFYDRNANMGYPNPRYRYTPGPERYNDPKSSNLVIDVAKATWSDNGTVCPEAVLHVVVADFKEGEKPHERHDRLGNETMAWLDANYPLHNDPLAYWD